jgi:hypothetical protein
MQAQGDSSRNICNPFRMSAQFSDNRIARRRIYLKDTQAIKGDS